MKATKSFMGWLGKKARSIWESLERNEIDYAKLEELKQKNYERAIYYGTFF